MSTHTDKIRAAILGSPAPRNLEWNSFVDFWRDVADEVEQESGDRLAVHLNGHREVFHRPHDGTVSIEDVERARHLLAATPEPKGSGRLLVVALDERSARILDFDLDAATVSDSARVVDDDDPRARHLRTVERHTGHDDEQDLVHYFDAIATGLQQQDAGRGFVVLGHGSGKSDAAAGFVERLRSKHADVARHLTAIGAIDLSAATDASIEAAAAALISPR